MFDRIVRILTDVRYVPDLMKITKGAMVIMKGKKIGNLYSYSRTQLPMELQCPPRQNQIMIT
jgi:hypothetical protein